MIRVRVPATSANLGPGFDTVGMALSIFNELCVEKSQRLKIEVFGEGTDRISRGEDNLVYRAFFRVFQELGRKPDSVKLILKNEIPLAREIGRAHV